MVNSILASFNAALTAPIRPLLIISSTTLAQRGTLDGLGGYMPMLLTSGSAMVNRNNPDPYVPSELELVFDSVWKEIRPPEIAHTEELRLRLALARRLVILSSSGVRDAANLRQRALEYFPPKRWTA